MMDSQVSREYMAVQVLIYSISRTYSDIVLKIDIEGCQKVIVFISNYWRGASPMLLCKKQ